MSVFPIWKVRMEIKTKLYRLNDIFIFPFWQIRMQTETKMFRLKDISKRYHYVEQTI